MEKELAIRNFHKTIINAAVEILGRPLTEDEKKFITSRRGYVALEIILDTVRGASPTNLEQYLNSEK
jgi:hypothetical protein